MLASASEARHAADAIRKRTRRRPAMNRNTNNNRKRHVQFVNFKRGDRTENSPSSCQYYLGRTMGPPSDNATKGTGLGRV